MQQGTSRVPAAWKPRIEKIFSCQWHLIRHDVGWSLIDVENDPLSSTSTQCVGILYCSFLISLSVSRTSIYREPVGWGMLKGSLQSVDTPGGVVSVCGLPENRFAESLRLLQKNPRKIELFSQKRPDNLGNLLIVTSSVSPHRRHGNPYIHVYRMMICMQIYDDIYVT